MDSGISIALLGCGVVGSGVMKILKDNQNLIEGKLGFPLHVKRIMVRNLSKARPNYIPADILTDDLSTIEDDDDIKIVCELMGGVSPARDYILRLIRAGKHIVTANKEVLAKHGPELLREAAGNGVSLRFEGSVAGGIPIIKPLAECLAANRITQLMGIINGTTNYILTKMSSEGREFAEVLSEAQEMGYAERDPSADVDGQDAAYKLAILTSIAFGIEARPEDIYTEGIRGITSLDLSYARELGFAVKLLAIAKEYEGKVQARVHPALIPLNHPLASVAGVYNAVFVQGNAVGQLMFYGRGAGSLPTASAVMADLMEAADSIARARPVSALAPMVKRWNGTSCLSRIDEVVTRYYIHLLVIDRPGVLAAIARSFGNAEVSLESVIQKGRGKEPVGLVFVTHRVRERNVQQALEEIRQLPVVVKVANVIRVEGEEA
ncbi:MAG TPA: homoserine dehydrogenase [Firmicutes bacterium]|nr:homoserine dehydrogenase [Bacillota bacterium]